MIISLVSNETQQGKSSSAMHLANAGTICNNKMLVVDWDERGGNRSISRLHDKYKPNVSYYVQSPSQIQLEGYDHVIIDTEGQLPKAKLAQVAKSDLIIIPTGLSDGELDSAMETKFALEENVSNPNELNYWILATNVIDEERFLITYRQFHYRHRVNMLNTYIPSASVIHNLVQQGLTAYDNRTEPKCLQVAKAYNQVWEAITNG